MKILKRILIAVLALVALILIVALFVPRDFKSEREIVINKPKQEVFDYIKSIKNQDNFGVWQLSDPDLKKTYEGTDGTVGFKYTWDSEKLGKGSQKIVNVVEGERMDTELDFGFGEPATASFTTREISPTQTRVSWGLSGRSPYPFNLMGLFFDVGDDFEKGLANLKNVLESN
ncbi:MAG: SRPBCC family protein [Chitinophagaceae bacterium]|nr:SRPBCC family protein [Chitinophagaceae bacterium]MCW5925889.1 SRPBCC family protein [Chitinophagaceae bacterium]